MTISSAAHTSPKPTRRDHGSSSSYSTQPSRKLIVGHEVLERPEQGQRDTRWRRRRTGSAAPPSPRPRATRGRGPPHRRCAGRCRTVRPRRRSTTTAGRMSTNDSAAKLVDRRQRDAPLEQAVDAPRHRHHEGGDRRLAVRDGQLDDGRRGEHEGHLLCGARPFLENGDPEHHRADRRHEVAEGRLDHPVVDDRVDVRRPVRREQRCGDGDAHANCARSAKTARIAGHRPRMDTTTAITSDAEAIRQPINSNALKPASCFQ